MATRRLNPAERRQEILSTAMSVFSKKGYQGVSLREIARECGMSAPGIMHYFPDMQNLLLAVLDHRDVVALDALGHELPAVGELRPFLDRIVKHNSERPEAARIYAMLQAETLSMNHPAREYFQKRTESAVDEFARCLEPLTPDSRTLARSLVAILDGLQLHWLSNPDSFDLYKQWTLVADAMLPAHRSAS